jgi:WD40 repeat protein
MTDQFDAFITAALFENTGHAIFALGDGTVRFESGEIVNAHDGAILCAAPHPSGDGLVTGGDDGRVVWSRAGGAVELAAIKGRWIDAVATSAASGLIGFSAGRDLHVRDIADPAFIRVFTHEKSVAAIDFDAKGRRIAPMAGRRCGTRASPNRSRRTCAGPAVISGCCSAPTAVS